MPADTKLDFLKRRRTFYTGHRLVTDSLFADNDFFDPRDLLQVKYEMLRRVRVDLWPVTRAIRAFGLARSTYYEAASQWAELGLLGLLPDRPGPRHAHKLTDEVVAAIAALRPADGSFDAIELAERLWQTRQLRVHPRTLEKAFRHPKKTRLP